MILKGWELIRDIAEGKIKEKEIKLKYGASYYTYYVEEDKIIHNFNGTGLYIGKCLNEDFELIEEQQDIQSIKKFEIDENDYIHTELGAFKTRKMDIAFLNKINETIEAIKELDRKIKE